MRAFIAIDLTAEARAALGELEQELAGSGADVAWVAPGQIHLTLKFLGDISDETQAAVERLLARVAAAQSPFEMSLREVGAFPSLAAPRVLWVGVGEGNQAAQRLAGAIEREGASVPLRRDERPFAPHVTIGRVRSPRRRAQLIERLRGIRWSPPAASLVEGLRLYQSTLTPSGPRYRVLCDVRLGAVPAGDEAGSGPPRE